MKTTLNSKGWRARNASNSDQWVVKVARGFDGPEGKHVIASSGSYESCKNWLRLHSVHEQCSFLERRRK